MQLRRENFSFPFFSLPLTFSRSSHVTRICKSLQWPEKVCNFLFSLGFFLWVFFYHVLSNLESSVLLAHFYLNKLVTPLFWIFLAARWWDFVKMWREEGFILWFRRREPFVRGLHEWVSWSRLCFLQLDSWSGEPSDFPFHFFYLLKYDSWNLPDFRCQGP